MKSERIVAGLVALVLAMGLSSGVALAAAKPAPAGKVNINSASAQQLTALPGVGEKLAARIVEYRQKAGGFKSVQEIMNVQGVGEKNFNKLPALPHRRRALRRQGLHALKRTGAAFPLAAPGPRFPHDRQVCESHETRATDTRWSRCCWSRPILLVAASISTPYLKAYVVEAHVMGAARAFKGRFRLAYSTAVRSGVYTAIRFERRGSGWQYSLYQDGDFDGVNAADIGSGRDKRIAGSASRSTAAPAACASGSTPASRRRLRTRACSTPTAMPSGSAPATCSRSLPWARPRQAPSTSRAKSARPPCASPAAARACASWSTAGRNGWRCSEGRPALRIGRCGAAGRDPRPVGRAAGAAACGASAAPGTRTGRACCASIPATARGPCSATRRW